MQENALVIGSNGSIGSAICQELEGSYKVHRISRDNCDYSDASLAAHSLRLQELGCFSKIICTIGVLHDDTIDPEKSFKQIETEKLAYYFHVNTILPTLCIKYFHRLLDKSAPSMFTCLSAMVGSTQDNQLGGWYGYRASKAALNSMIKTASIEIARTHKHACLLAIHPGTTIGDLSAPFAKKLTSNNYYTPEQSAKRILSVMDSFNATQSGGFYNWDSQRIEW